MRAWYLSLWREDDTGGPWPIIFANLKFATFNVSLAVLVAVVGLVLRVT